MPMQNPERVVTKQDLKDFYDQIYPYLGGSSSSGVSETMVAPVESDATSSSKAYAIGEQLILDGTLYKATAAISINDALVVGTNIAASDDLVTQIDGKADSSDLTDKADKVTSATNGNFAGLDANGNLTDSGSKASDFLTSHQDITGKADKVSSATSGNFAGLDANGNLTDSGSKASDFLTQHQDISGKQNKTLDTPITIGGTNQTTVEGALGGLNTAKENKSTVLTSTLAVGATTLTFTDASIGNNSKIRYYSDPFTVGLIENATQSGTTITLTCKEQASAVSVTIEVVN